MTYPIIEHILETKIVHDKNEKAIPLKANIDRTEGMFLYNFINDNPHITRTLEVGCAYALSSLFICSALEKRENPEHIVIDPNQYSYYDGVGVLNLDRAGVSFYKLMEDRSEFAMPQLLAEAPASFDMIFIDGSHAFDQVALDFYYANRLVKVGGFIIFDDCSFASVSKVVRYALKYPAYRLHSQVKETSNLKKFLRFFLKLVPEFGYTYLLPLKLNNFYNRLRTTSMVAIEKISEDERDWKWFADF